MRTELRLRELRQAIEVYERILIDPDSTDRDLEEARHRLTNAACEHGRWALETVKRLQKANQVYAKALAGIAQPEFEAAPHVARNQARQAILNVSRILDWDSEHAASLREEYGDLARRLKDITELAP